MPCNKQIAAVLLLASMMMVSSAQADFSSPRQKKDWFYLQTLAQEIRTLLLCQALYYERSTAGDSNAAQKMARAEDAHSKATDELATEVEAYVKTYPEARGPNETTKSYIYRVWSVVIRAEDDAKQPTEAVCGALLM